MEKKVNIPSDNYSHEILIYNLLKKYSKADLVISYTINTDPKIRNACSILYNFCIIFASIHTLNISTDQLFMT